MGSTYNSSIGLFALSVYPDDQSKYEAYASQLIPCFFLHLASATKHALDEFARGPGGVDMHYPALSSGG